MIKKLQKNYLNSDGILVPGGFGERGINGKIIKYKPLLEKIISLFLVFVLECN